MSPWAAAMAVFNALLFPTRFSDRNRKWRAHLRCNSRQASPVWSVELSTTSTSQSGNSRLLVQNSDSSVWHKLSARLREQIRTLMNMPRPSQELARGKLISKHGEIER